MRASRRAPRGLLVAIGLTLALVFVASAVLAPSFKETLVFANAASEILGTRGQRRYLVLAQNPAELRPAGGYAGTIGVVGFQDLRITERQFVDVYEYDLRPNVPFVEPPQALANALLAGESWKLADAAWSPDFPTAAQDALRLYELESGDRDIAGVIALNTYAIDRLLEVTGPIDVPGYGQRVAAGEVTLIALANTRGVSTPGSQRKAFLDALAGELLVRLQSMPPTEWPRLAQALSEMATERSLLAWFKDPEAQAFAERALMDGAVRNEPGDYVYVVEANVAPTSKYNLVVDRSDELIVHLDEAGNATGRLNLRWDNRAMEAGEPYASIRAWSTSPVGVYGAYIRVLTPRDTTFVSIDGNGLDPVRDADEVSVEADRLVVGNYVLMGPGDSRMAYVWQTPNVAAHANGSWRYSLTVQKQPGLRAMPLAINVVLPASARVVALPEGATMESTTVQLMTRLSQDAELHISYRLD